MERTVTLMSMTLMITINVCLDVGILGALALVMAQPRRLSAHRRMTPVSRPERHPQGVPGRRTRATHGAPAAGRDASVSGRH